MLHSLIGLADILLEREARFAGGAVHINFMTAAADMQLCAAVGADKSGFGITGGKKSHEQFLPDVAVAAPPGVLPRARGNEQWRASGNLKKKRPLCQSFTDG